MGFLDKVFGGKKKKKGALLGGALGGIGGAILGSGGKDLLFGKEQGGVKGGFVPMDPRYSELLAHSMPARREQISRLNQILKEKSDPRGMAKQITDLKRSQITRGLGQLQEDQLRRNQQMLAQRGLGNSSIGIGSALNIQRDIGKDIARQRADLAVAQPMLERQLANQDLQRKLTAFGGIGQAFSGMPSQRDYIMPQQATRQGGIADILGTVGGAAIGAKLGGPQGAMAGSRIGGSLARFGRGMS